MSKDIMFVKKRDKLMIVTSGVNGLNNVIIGKIGYIIYREQWDDYAFQQGYFAKNIGKEAFKLINDKLQEVNKKGGF